MGTAPHVMCTFPNRSPVDTGPSVNAQQILPMRQRNQLSSVARMRRPTVMIHALVPPPHYDPIASVYLPHRMAWRIIYISCTGIERDGRD